MTCPWLTSPEHADLEALLHAAVLALGARFDVDLAVFLVAAHEREVVAVVAQEERLQQPAITNQHRGV